MRTHYENDVRASRGVRNVQGTHMAMMITLLACMAHKSCYSACVCLFCSFHEVHYVSVMGMTKHSKTLSNFVKA